jgi:butyryl-CoA dehydrogenase
VDFELSEDHRMLRDTVRAWATAKVEPLAPEIDRNHRYPAELVRDMAAMGLLGITVPERFGGAGMDTIAYALAMEEVSRACASTGVIMSVQSSLVSEPILKWGTDAQKDRFLPRLAKGEILGCFALSEPGSGSDAAAMKCTATRDGEGWRIDGTKNWITNGPQADLCVLICNGPEKGVRNSLSFIVDLHRDGVRSGKPEHKLGICGSGTSSLIFEGYRATDDEVLGGPGQGFKVAMTTLDGGRIGIAAQAVGIARAAFEAAVRYSGERQAFGSPLHGLQAIQFKLADMAVEIDAARLLVLRAAWLKSRGEKHTKEAAMAKLFASEMSHRVCHQALQVFGGYGYVTEFPVERHYRDQRITEIYEGTSEIQRLVIAREVVKEAERWTSG